MIPPPVVSCPRCRAALPEGVLHGLCPACLIDAAGMDSEAGTAADPFGAPLDLETLRRSFPQFEILAPIGAGGMGRVYKVRQPNLDRIVALKILPPELARNPAWVERFTREARALARLNHPHIVQVYDVGQTTGEPPLCWLIMEFVDGVTLRQVQRTGGLSAREALTIIPRLCDALQYAHEKGVLHRDIKPENILLDASGAVKIADFGLAKLGGANSPCTLTQAGARLGTAAYMAPEQIETPQDVDHRADIYSLGVVFYELLTGGLPLGRFPAPSEKSGVDPRLDHIVFRTLEKERTRRFQAAGEVRTALDRVAAGPVAPPPIPPGAARGSSVPVQPAGSPVPAQIRQTNPELPGSVKVGFRDRNRRFPGSSWEAAGYGCGWAICAPVRVAAFLAAWLLPLGVRNFLARGRYEEFTNGLETYASWAVWIAAATGLISYFAVRSVAAIPAGSRKIQNPLILVLCLLVWCFTLTYIAVESRSWPTRGSGSQLIFSCDRPPLVAGSEPQMEGKLKASFADETRKAFAGEETAVIEGAEKAGNSDGRSPVTSRQNPLRCEWVLTAAGDSLRGIQSRLLTVAQAMLTQVPPSLRESVEISMREHHAWREGWHLDIRGEGLAVITGILMAVAGWLAAVCGGRSKAGLTIGAVPAGCALLLNLLPANWQASQGAVIPAGDPKGSSELTSTALKSMVTSEDDGSAASAVARWIDACMRLDKQAAEQLAYKMTPTEWKQKASFWLRNHLLSVEQSSSPDSAGGEVKDVTFACLVVPMDESGMSSLSARRMVILAHRNGQTWTVSQ